MAHRGRYLRYLTIPALALLVLGIAAAVRAGGEAPAPPSPGLIYEALGEAVAVLIVAVGIGALAVVIWAFPRPIPGKSRRPRRSRWRLLITVAITYVAFGLLFLQRGKLPARPGTLAGGLLGRPPVTAGHALQLSAFDWAGFALGGAAVVALALFLAWQMFGGRRAGSPVSDAAIAEGAEAGLAELASIRDPRVAVIRAYAAMEFVLARRGLGRYPHEAPNEYLRRLVAGSSARVRAAATLTSLYQVARFSIHPVSRDMKDEAIAAFESMKAAET